MMSRSRLFLGGLVSTRARLRFNGRSNDVPIDRIRIPGPQKVAHFSTGIMPDFQPELTIPRLIFSGKEIRVTDARRYARHWEIPGAGWLDHRAPDQGAIVVREAGKRANIQDGVRTPTSDEAITATTTACISTPATPTWSQPSSRQVSLKKFWGTFVIFC